MTDLLVSSLMADGGLETSLQAAITGYFIFWYISSRAVSARAVSACGAGVLGMLGRI